MHAEKRRKEKEKEKKGSDKCDVMKSRGSGDLNEVK
jgi:hypothetical protein